MYLLRKALEPFKEVVLSTGPDFSPHRSASVVYPGEPFGIERPPTAFKFRSDYEFELDHNNMDWLSNGGPLPPNMVDGVFDQLEKDVEDFIIFANTDLEPSKFYPNLSAFDGVIKRGDVPKTIDLVYGLVYREFKTMKDSIEVTTFVTLDIKW
jgi:hypothetical protein